MLLPQLSQLCQPFSVFSCLSPHHFPVWIVTSFLQCLIRILSSIYSLHWQRFKVHLNTRFIEASFPSNIVCKQLTSCFTCKLWGRFLFILGSLLLTWASYPTCLCHMALEELIYSSPFAWWGPNWNSPHLGTVPWLFPAGSSMFS